VPAGIWRVKPLCSFHWRRWGDEWLIFDEGSGDTHHMDGVSAVVLMCLDAAPCDLSELSEQVSVETDLPQGEDLSRAVASVVERFSGLGLIEPATP
jgi:PqqD family protein of HPr-rel-A system